MRHANPGWAAVILAAMLLAADPAPAPPAEAGAAREYVVIDLGTLDDHALEPNGLNNRDEVVGATTDARDKPVLFEWVDEQVTRLRFPPGADSARVVGITDDGVILGSASYGWLHAFVWADAKKDPKDIGTLGGPAADIQGASRSGLAVGNSRRGGDRLWTPYLWRDGKMTAVPTPSGGGGVAFGVNDKGDVVGDYSLVENGFDPPFRAFLWRDGAGLDLGTLGGDFAAAAEINNNGWVVGVSRTANGQVHSFLWINGKMQDLGTLGGAASHPNRISEEGVVVGWSETGASRHACLWKQDKIVDLNAWLPAGSGWVLTEARDMNDRGCVVGIGLHNDKIRGFLMKPRNGEPKKPD